MRTAPVVDPILAHRRELKRRLTEAITLKVAAELALLMRNPENF
jgi:hypothetical protein